jgi:hypothetical protein
MIQLNFKNLGDVAYRDTLQNFSGSSIKNVFTPKKKFLDSKNK